VNDEQCHVCRSDPGPGAHCGNCGTRQYRYATEDAHSTAIQSADVTAELGPSNSPAPIERQASSTQSQSSHIERTDVFSQTQQRSEVRKIEGSGQPVNTFGIDTGDSDDMVSSGRSILLRMVLLAILIAGVLITQFPEWRETQQATIPTSVTLPALDLDAPLSAPRLLASWDGLALGDCVLWPATGTEFPTVVDCRSAHDAEISGIASLTHASWPFAEEAFDLSDQCLAVFPAYVGEAFALSQWRSGWIAPSQEEWDAGVRNYQCYVYLRENRTDQRAYQSGT
jgi:hypothetical protein